MNVENIENGKGNKVANQFIITDTNKKVFQSYKTKIATLEQYVPVDTLVLNGNWWNYSATTRKYFKQFINEETPFNYEDKKQFLKEIDSNNLIKVV